MRVHTSTEKNGHRKPGEGESERGPRFTDFFRADYDVEHMILDERIFQEKK